MTPIPYNDLPIELFPRWTLVSIPRCSGEDIASAYANWLRNATMTRSLFANTEDGTVDIYEYATLLELPRLVEKEFKVQVTFAEVVDESVDDEW